MSGDSPADLRDLAERAARAAGALVRDERPDALGVAATKSSPTDVVTEMDQRSEALLRSLIAQARPDDGLLGEEGGHQPGSTELTWVIDPIDGTVNYLYRLPAYTVSVAVVTGDPTRPGGWQPVAGCVHAPATGETFTAALGMGSSLDGARLRLADPPPLERALVATGFSYVATIRADQARVLAHLLPRVRDIRRIGSAALDLCMVACGRVDAFYERQLNPWDLAAAMLVITEAGGCVRGIAGRPPGRHMVVAAAHALCDRLAAELEAVDAGE